MTAAEPHGRSLDSRSARIAEEPVPGEPPRFELRAWREELGLVAGITGRGTAPGRGFDLGLWSAEPVGEVMSRWRLLRRCFPEFSSIVLGNQVHGTEVRTAGPSEGWVQVDGVDGWVTTASGVLLTVTVADCIPVYLAVPGRGIALLHAGWRGTAGGILRRGLARLLAETKADSSEAIMHCGVGICGPCYEVGSEVRAGCGLAANGPGPWHVDLRQVLAEEAVRLGLTTITVSSHCSAHERSTFYSHRASRGTDGRMVAYLGLPQHPGAAPVLD
ncbi:MAG TPA: polyphenol oxidase family protein [Gemmatimonadales bacterium]|nr:polyphenol oxidase family protein [Gemmatimonadales bacterium]